MLSDRIKLWVQIVLVVVFVALIPVSFVTGWIKSVTFVSLLSLWALVAAHGSWAEAAAVKVKQREEESASSHGG